MLNLQGNIGLLAAVAIVVIGLLVIGIRDVLRLSLGRIWAIATVCFRQSIRRRVLWLTPVVIIGVIIVSQFQRAVDAQELVQQTITYCLFATGTLVTLVAIMLAATNLPQEIDSRVMYTVATKPTTRLEIVLGKVVGFMGVSFWILLIMGLFTFGYVHLRDWRQRAAIAQQLEAISPDAVNRPMLEYHRREGTLHARDLGLPQRLAVLASVPASPPDRWVSGLNQASIVARFRIDPQRVPRQGQVIGEPAPQNQGNGGLILQIDLKARSALPATASTNPPSQSTVPPYVAIEFRDTPLDTSLPASQIGLPPTFALDEAGGTIQALLHEMVVDRLLGNGVEPVDIYLAVTAADEYHDIFAAKDDFLLITPDGSATFRPEELYHVGRQGRYGQQLRGERGPARSVALYEFRNQPLPPGSGSHSFVIRAGFEPSWEDEQDLGVAEALIDIHNLKTDTWVRDIQVKPEHNRSTFFEVPAAAVAGGDFDVILRVPRPGWLGLRDGEMSSLQLIRNDQSFAWNLAKSLLILWMMSLLVTIIALFASTFVSWPIAILLTATILIGHWSAKQLLDATTSGTVGRQVVEMFPGGNPGAMRAISESVDALVRTLDRLAAVLPDISQFAAIRDIENGVAIAPATLAGAARVAFGFGVPLLVLAYLLLKNKEVAP